MPWMMTRKREHGIEPGLEVQPVAGQGEVEPLHAAVDVEVVVHIGLIRGPIRGQEHHFTKCGAKENGALSPPSPDRAHDRAARPFAMALPRRTF